MAIKEIHSAYVLADSYGGKRVHNNSIDVSLEQTYPYLLKKQFPTITFSVDTASFRKLTDFPLILKSLDTRFDLYILQAGIVDCYPRPLSQHLTISQSFSAKLLRKLIRVNRALFIKLIRSKPWSLTKDVEDALINSLEILKHKKVIVLNISPVNKFQDKQTPNANKNISAYNAIIKKACEKYPNVQLVDIHSALEQNPEMEMYMHPVDSHPNVKGNELYASLLFDIINKI